MLPLHPPSPVLHCCLKSSEKPGSSCDAEDGVVLSAESSRRSHVRLFLASLLSTFTLFVFMLFFFCRHQHPVVPPIHCVSCRPPPPPSPTTLLCLCLLTTAALLGEVIRRSSTEMHVQLLRAATSGFCSPDQQLTAGGRGRGG